MLVITSTSPEVTNLLGLDVGHLERGAVKRRSGHLEDRQRGDKRVEGLRHTRNRGDQRGQRKVPLLLDLARVGNSNRAQESGSEDGFHHDGQQRLQATAND